MLLSKDAIERFKKSLPFNKRRITREIFYKIFRSELPEYAYTANSRAALRDAIDGLKHYGFRLPVNKKLYDESADPPIPFWIEMPKKAHEYDYENSVIVKEHFWAPELSFIWEEKIIKKESLQRLLLIDDWLKNKGRTTKPIPTKERSFEVFGNEKEIDHYLRNSIYFKKGFISLELLKCYDVYEPLANKPGPEFSLCRPCLVIENFTTWWTIAEWNKKNGSYSTIVYGCGNRFRKTWKGLLDLKKQYGFNEVSYFGDLDAKGLEIPFLAGNDIENISSLSFYLEKSLYQLLIDIVMPEKYLHANGLININENIASWLPHDIKESILRIIRSGYRIPQEAITLNVLKKYMK